MFAYCNNNPRSTTDSKGCAPFASFMLPDSGHYIPPDSDPEPKVEFKNDDGTLLKFYENNIEKTIETSSFTGTTKSIVVRYDGMYHADSGSERFWKGVLDVAITEGICFIADKYTAFPFSAVFGVVAVTAEAIKDPSLRSGDYKCYTAIVRSEYTDSSGVAYVESVFFNYYVNDSSFYRFTERWYTPIDPSQVYYWP